MKKRLKISIAAVCAVLITATALVIYYYGGASPLFYKDNKTGLVRCSYSVSGGMEGSSYFVSLKNNKDGTATLTVSSTEHANAAEKTKKYDAPLSALEELEKIINSYGIPSWSKCKDNPIFAYDADTTSLQFLYGDGKSVSVNSTQLLPRKSGEAISAVLDKMLSYTTE